MKSPITHRPAVVSSSETRRITQPTNFPMDELLSPSPGRYYL